MKNKITRQLDHYQFVQPNYGACLEYHTLPHMHVCVRMNTHMS